jgi:acyl carrier protein
MFEKVQAILAKQLRLDPSKITPQSLIKKDLGADSLDLFELTMALEEEYDLEIPAEELEAIETVGDVIEFLKSKGIDD